MQPIDGIPNGRLSVRVTAGICIYLACICCLNDVVVAQTSQRPLTNDQRAFFESKIRPVLTKTCYQCHSSEAKQVKGGLMLDNRQSLLRGGVDGPVIIPGNPDKSMLIQAIRYKNDDLVMPPEEVGGKLPDAVIHDFETWVKMGAPDPRDGAAISAPANYDTTEAKKWWAFQPLKRPTTAPSAPKSDWTRGDIDRYVTASQSSRSLKPVGDADKQTLIRRVYFDLIGLPPAPEEVDTFIADNSPSAFDQVVDHLLSLPQFGEHWGRHWLDVARYAESAGKEFNATYPDAWRYRDYVISSFNQDKPFTQFIREQLAGDLIPTLDARKRAEQTIATGFLAIGPKGLSEQASRQFDLDLADDQVDATSQAFIGLTLSCARCHDHKFDPMLQKDYYAMAGIFLSTKTCFGTLAGPRNNEESDLIELSRNTNQPVVGNNLTPQQRDQLKKELADVTQQYDELLPGRRGARRGAQPAQADRGNAVQTAAQLRNLLGRKAQLEDQLNSYDESGRPKAFCMGAQDRPAGTGPIGPMPPVQTGPQGNPIKRQSSGFDVIADSPLFFRGEMSEPRERVARGVPLFLTWNRPPPITRAESGRKELADWIASERNPLTARVMANRIWYWLFGTGIVGSVDNFGTMGDKPSNQALLDYLANRLIDNRWSVKKTIREIVLSHTYQLASTYDENDYGEDPQNVFLWRHSKLRLNAECLRDAMLSSSGQLDLKPPIGSAVAYAGNGAIGAGPAYDRINEQLFIDVASTNRSVYLPAPRDVIPDCLAVFDYPDATTVNGARETTNVPSQALFLLNNEFVRQQARLLGQRILNAYPQGSGGPQVLRQNRVNMAFRLILGRPANETEQNAATQFFATMLNEPLAPIGRWQDFCLALYNTAEFRYLN